MSPIEILRIIALVVVVLLFPAGFVAGCWDEKARRDAQQKAEETIAEAQRKATIETIARGKRLKEASDAENSAALATLAGFLRDARRRPVSAPAACPSSPDGADRFRAESERAYRDLVEGLRGEGERCSKAVIGLNTGKGWASNTRSP